jgi:hypothetical protein
MRASCAAAGSTSIRSAATSNRGRLPGGARPGSSARLPPPEDGGSNRQWARAVKKDGVRVADASNSGPALPLVAAALNAGTAKWALVASTRVASAMHPAWRAHRPKRECQPPAKKIPRLRAGRAARVGGKRWTDGGAAKSVRRAWRSRLGAKARCMMASARSRDLSVSMGLSVHRRAPGRGGGFGTGGVEYSANAIWPEGACDAPGGGPGPPLFVL